MDSAPAVVFFGTYDSASHPRVEVLREGFAAHGFDVVEVNRPLGVPTGDRVGLLGRPWRAPLLAARILRAWLTLIRQGWRWRKRAEVVVVGYLGHFDVHLARRLFRAPVVLDHLVGLGDTATDRGADGAGAVTRLLGWIDRRALAAADVVVVDTDEQASQCPPSTAPVVVPVGAPRAWFDAAAAADVDPHAEVLSVVFFGLYTPLQGAVTIGEAIGALGDHDNVSLTMIGDGQDRAATEAAATGGRVRWLDWVDSTELPAVVAAHHVCLGIFGDTPKGARVVPNKVFQGAAAGCAVVTSDTAPQRRALGDDAAFVPVADAVALADTLRSLATDRARLVALRHAASARAAAHFGAAAVVAPVLDRLGVATPEASTASDR